MILGDLIAISKSADSADLKAAGIDAARNVLAEARKNMTKVPLPMIFARNYGTEEAAKNEFAKDFSAEILGSIMRVTEMRLEKEAREHRNKARILRMQISAAIGGDE